MNIGGEKVLLKIKLLMACALMVSLSCLPILADGDYFDPFAVVNRTIYLDSSKVEHPILNGVFPSPSEYKKQNKLPADIFSSTNVLDSVPSPSEYKPKYTYIRDDVFTPTNNLDNLPSPSEYKVNRVVKNKPPVGSIEESTNENSILPSEIPELKEINPISQEKVVNKAEIMSRQEDNYSASLTEVTSYDNIDIEGKTISDIKIEGLVRVNENTVLNSITSRNGSKFSAERVQHDLQQIYYLGYFKDSMQVEPTLNEDGTISLRFILEENPLVKEVQFIGNTIYSSNTLETYTKNLVDMPENMYLINQSIENIDNHYHSNGYILEQITSIDDTADGTLSFKINEGLIEKVLFEGNKRTKDYIIERSLITKPGSIYNESTMKDDLARVYATRLFKDVNRTIEQSTDNNEQYVVTVNVTEESYDSVSIGGGIDNALGVFGTLNVLSKNFLGRGQEIGASGMIGSGLLLSDQSIKNRINYQVELFFKEPHFINADNSLFSKIYFRELGSYQVPLAIERRFGINGTVTHKIDGNDNLTTNLGLGFENIHLREGDLAKITQMYNDKGIDISQRKKQLTGGNFINIAPGVQYSTLDNNFMPREGTIAKANFIESLAIGSFKNTNGRLVGSVTQYIPLFEKSTLLIGARGGIKVHGKDMPEVMAFRLGGPYDIRGFKMNGVGSGDSFLMGSAELQTPIPFMDKLKYEVLKNLRFAVFIDAGKIFDPTITSKLYDRPNGAISAGVGLRVNIPGLGPISVDYGLPLTHVGRYNSKHGYFTFGTGGLYDSY